VEEKQADVSRLDVLVSPFDKVHLPRQLDEGHLGRVAVQVAADFLQVRLDQRQPQVGEIRLVALAIVERDRRRQPQQFLLVLAVGLDLDGAGVAAEVVMVLLRLGGDGSGSLVRAILPTGRPEHDQVPSFVLLDAQDREVGGLNQVAVGQQLPLNPVELVGLEADGREGRLPVGVTVLPDDDVAAAQILEVVGKGA
jgi:hypothetical protein